MEEYEMIKTTLVGGYKKEEVQELIQKLKNEKAEVEADYKQQIAEKDSRIAELQKRLELKDDYQLRLEDEIKEKYQKYIDNFESIGKLVLEAQLKADSMEEAAKRKTDEMLKEAENEAKNRVENVENEIEEKLAEGEKRYHVLQERMNELKRTIEQVQEKVENSCGEILQVINAASDLLSGRKTENSNDENQYLSEEVDEELDFLDSPEDVEELEEFDEEDDEDEDSKLALQISKLLSEEDEVMMEEELDDL